VLSWVEGERLSDLLVTGDAETIGASAFAAGRVLASIHTVRFAHGGFLGSDLAVRVPFGKGGWEAGITGWAIEGQGRRWLGEERATRLAKLVHDQRDEVASDPSPPTLLHADYNGKNLLMRQDGQGWAVAAVLDWEFAFAGSPLFDLGIFLRADADLAPSYADEFGRGYQANGGTLPPNWRRISKLLDLINLCQFLDTTVERPLLFAEVLRRIDATLELFAG
jgi:aminoglycoside phosphotransferase (APT) family kinase protein